MFTLHNDMIDILLLTGIQTNKQLVMKQGAVSSNSLK